MKSSRLFLGIICCAQICVAGENEKTFSSFAIVELFTSEGCSSCPPADNLLTKIGRDARQKNQSVFPMAFHVDYWNNLGWNDPLSHSDFTMRQRHYAQVLGTDVYTPQIIINGKDAFVGSDRIRALQSIETVLEHSAQVLLELKVDARSHRNTFLILIKYKVFNVSKKHVLHIALLEHGLKNKILHGENIGLTLQHENVVRLFKTISLENGSVEGDLELEYFKIVTGKISIVGYVQDIDTMKILGATRYDF
jgi:hypothetical protein